MKDIHSAPALAQVRADLYLGNRVPHITDNELWNFLNRNVTPNFPGFTVTLADGSWKGETELTRVLSILADDKPGFRPAIRSIAENYKRQFKQESVIYTFTALEIAWNCHPYTGD